MIKKFLKVGAVAVTAIVVNDTLRSGAVVAALPSALGTGYGNVAFRWTGATVAGMLVGALIGAHE